VTPKREVGQLERRTPRLTLVATSFLIVLVAGFAAVALV